MAKYKCNQCGHEFEGDRSTKECPQCGCTDFAPVGSDGGAGKKVLKYAACILAGGLILWGAVELFAKHDSTITATLTNNNDGTLTISIDGVKNPKDLQKEYWIIQQDSNFQNIDQPYRFNGHDFSINIPIDDSHFIQGATYYFKFSRVDEQPIKSFHWDGSNSYTRPLPPEAPVISVSKESDCTNKTYTITIKVEKGNPDKFYLNDILQDSPVFTNVQQGKIYEVKAFDSFTELYSGVITIDCRKSIREFHVSQTDIQRVFDRVASQDIFVGDAMDIISNGKNVRLTQNIDGCCDLEEILNHSYTQQVQYEVTATIINTDCADEVQSISARRK